MTQAQSDKIFNEFNSWLDETIKITTQTSEYAKDNGFEITSLTSGAMAKAYEICKGNLKEISEKILKED